MKGLISFNLMQIFTLSFKCSFGLFWRAIVFDGFDIMKCHTLEIKITK